MADPPLFHYTSGFSVACILNSGAIEVSRLNTRDEGEQAAVWLSYSPEWESLTCQPLESLLGQDWGKWRIQVLPQGLELLEVEEWILKTGCSKEDADFVRKTSKPTWRATLRDIPQPHWQKFEYLDSCGVWVSVPISGWQHAYNLCQQRRTRADVR